MQILRTIKQALLSLWNRKHQTQSFPFSNPPTQVQPHQPETPIRTQFFTREAIQMWKAKLENVMKVSQPHLNPKLSVADLAHLLQTDPLTTSRIIHEGFQLSFYDFINTYRLEHLVQLSRDENYQHHTILSLAYEAGFNAKSTFYKVCKKLKNMTPVAYLKLVNENVDN